MKRNPMKEKLRAGEPVFGVSVMIPSPQIVEMVAAAGFDWVLLDCEHGTLTLESVELMAMAAEASGITAIARPVTKSPEHILQVLDRGVMGVQVPHVNTAQDAREVLAAVKYHPAGRRGLAAGTRAAQYDAHGTLADYVKAANDATLIAIQLEDVDRVRVRAYVHIGRADGRARASAGAAALFPAAAGCARRPRRTRRSTADPGQPPARPPGSPAPPGRR